MNRCFFCWQLVFVFSVHVFNVFECCGLFKARMNLYADQVFLQGGLNARSNNWWWKTYLECLRCRASSDQVLKFLYELHLVFILCFTLNGSIYSYCSQVHERSLMEANEVFLEKHKGYHRLYCSPIYHNTEYLILITLTHKGYLVSFFFFGKEKQCYSFQYWKIINKILLIRKLNPRRSKVTYKYKRWKWLGSFQL